ncbi:YebC/PmpR family DNA-binding transcriptional regulator [Candidatus Peregrinibacteria bacterium]|nr:YebC/PmpR family DNA-binding transcriptional regulator [Candidatus Peregrinibacteria bacterium]
MSGHSKWHSIKHKKGAADAKRGKIFTKHAKLIAIAAKEGGDDPEMNPALRTAIANAKADNVPNANIEKAVKKGAGEGKEGMGLTETIYEGFGPAGTAVYVQVVTDNKNRAVASVKNIFTKHGGGMGEAGSVAWMFDKKGIILAKADNKSPEEAQLDAIDAGAEEISVEGKDFEIITDPQQLMNVRHNLENSGFKVEKAELSYIPNTPVKIDNMEDAKKILNLVEALEDDEDVANVYSNFDIPEEILEEIV